MRERDSIECPEHSCCQILRLRPLFRGGHRRGLKSVRGQRRRQDGDRRIEEDDFNDILEFSESSCSKLKFPCRFVSDHPCCTFEMPLDLVARARGMDGSADLKWRRRQRLRNTSRARSLFHAPVKYTFARSKAAVAAPRYFFASANSNSLFTVLSNCWRMVYDVHCRETEKVAHPCCRIASKPNEKTVAQNAIARWLNADHATVVQKS